AVTGLLTMLAIAAGRVVQPLILRAIIDRAVPAGDTGLLLRYAVFYLILVLSSGFLGYVGSIQMAKLGLAVVTKIKQDLFSRFLRLPVSYFDAHPVGELMARTENDTEKIRDLFSSLGLTLVVSILMMGGMFFVTSLIAPVLSLAMLAAAVGFLAILLFFYKRIIGLYESSRSLYASIVAKLTEFVQGMEILKAFNRRAWAEDSLDESGRKKRENDTKVSLLEFSASSALEAMAGPFFIVVLILLYGEKVAAGLMSLGTLLLFIEYGASLMRPVLEIAESLRRIQQAKASMNRISSTLALEPESRAWGGKPAVLDKEIRFDSVWFSYRGEDWILKDISFNIPKGSTTAIVGSSGSGKSTAIGLLCGFAKPQKGCLSLDGDNLVDLDLESWRRKIGLVLQDVYLFPGTVLDNIRVYNDEISPQRVQEALDQVQASGFVASLPEGIMTNLWERGGNLSAGEKQLLAFARALCADPELVILDEATSSVDMETEEKIRASLATLLAGRTSVIVAHRLSSVIHADQILFFSQGRIAARGTHSQLYRDFPEYKELVDRQFIARKAL
ncbi:MAG: ABC transporter ATP-binding protein, partial [Spirochaetia bacterium]|nr:ABC transporter ATP-binding protein [Spirochaetia bacterium]